MDVAVFDAINIQGLLSDSSSIELNSGDHMFKALVDTGAQKTMISRVAAKKIGLRPIGSVPVIGVGGQSHHNNYLFHIAFIVKEREDKSNNQLEIGIHTLAEPIEGAELNLEGTGFDVLLGMDVISTGSLAVEGSGTYSFSF